MNLVEIGGRVRDIIFTPGPNIKVERETFDRLLIAYRERTTRLEGEDLIGFNDRLDRGQSELLVAYGRSIKEGKAVKFVENYINPETTVKDK